VTDSRRYISPKRQAQVAATRDAILQAFAEQLGDPERADLSPSEAARQAGVSVRTVHAYFPNADDQIVALGEWFDRQFYPAGVRVVEGPDDLARYFRDIHKFALKTPMARALATARSPVWREVRQRRRAERLDAIRRSVTAIGAPRRATEDAIATLLSLSGADASWTMHDYGLPLDRIPGAIARTVQLVVDDLETAAARRRQQHAPTQAAAPTVAGTVPSASSAGSKDRKHRVVPSHTLGVQPVRR
jgi:AcrR family transcriptional regulator